MQSRPLLQGDAKSVWMINEQGLPGTGKVSVDEIQHLISISKVALGVFEQEDLVGFIICLSPNVDYDSLNYAWFNERYEEFFYIDRIAVSTSERNKGIGSYLYRELIELSNQKRIPIAAEVNLKPLNVGSMRFHFGFNFSEIGILHHKEKSVTMLLRQVDESV